MLSRVGFAVGTGRTVGLIGPNGSGKTTTLRVVLGAQPMSSGEVRLDGASVSRLPARRMALAVAAVLQEEPAVLPLTVRETVLLGRSVHLSGWQRTRPADEAAAAAALDRTGVAHLAERVLTDLSGGERQRVLIARALAQGSPHLLLDEPTNHLDIRFQHEVLDLVAALPTTTVVVLHDLNLAARYCDELVLLDRGRIAATGAPEQVLRPEVLEPVYGIHVRRVDHDGVPQLTFAPRAGAGLRSAVG